MIYSVLLLYLVNSLSTSSNTGCIKFFYSPLYRLSTWAIKQPVDIQMVGVDMPYVNAPSGYNSSCAYSSLCFSRMQRFCAISYNGARGLTRKTSGPAAAHCVFKLRRR